MSTLAAFHEVRFPIAVGLGARVAPERRTEIVTLGSGREERNARWAHARRRYDAGPGVRSLADLQRVVAFFEERRGRLHGFRFKDPLDHVSGPAESAPVPNDQEIGVGDATRAAFPLIKTYAAGPNPYVRPITKPVAGSVRVAVAGVERLNGVHLDVDTTTGVISFRPGHIPAAGAIVTAGFAFDVPVRFDSDVLDINVSRFRAGEIPTIPLIEIVP
jgi:uncharacterized protein (TIGR02217 family)